MNFFKSLWPWSKFRKYEDQISQLKCALEFEQADHEYTKKVHKEADANHTNDMRKMALAAAIKAGVTFALLLFCFSGFGQSILRNNLDTNAVAPAGGDGYLLESIGGVPTWTKTITAQVENWWDTAANIDTNVWPIGVLTWAYDGYRWTGGDGARKGGQLFGIRYTPSFTNFPTWAGGRKGELLVTTNGLLGAFFTSQQNSTTLYMNAADGTNWIPIMQVIGSDISSNDIAINKETGTFSIGIDTNGVSVSSGTGGTHGTLNGGIGVISGAGGDASGAGSVGGNGGVVGANGFVIQLIGGHGGAATNAGTAGNGGRSGVIVGIGGNGGASTNGSSAGNAGNAGTITINGGNGSNDGTTSSKTGGNGGSITTSGGNALTDAAGNNYAGGFGGAITTAASGTNAGGNLTMSSPGTTRRGGNLTSFGSSYVPMVPFTTTTSAGLSAASGPSTLLGTAQFLSSPGQATGKTIGSNVVDHIGRMGVFHLEGYIATSLTPTLDIVASFGGTTFIDTGAQTLVGITGNQTWTFDGTVTFRTTGATATAIGQGIFRYFSTATTVNEFSTANTGTVTLNTAADATIDFQATFSANNTIQCTSAYWIFMD